MTAEEIAAVKWDNVDDARPGDSRATFYMLREIAYQLAELNAAIAVVHPQVGIDKMLWGGRGDTNDD